MVEQIFLMIFLTLQRSSTCSVTVNAKCITDPLFPLEFFMVAYYKIGNEKNSVVLFPVPLKYNRASNIDTYLKMFLLLSQTKL